MVLNTSDFVIHYLFIFFGRLVYNSLDLVINVLGGSVFFIVDLV